jgi:esterase/lipase
MDMVFKTEVLFYSLTAGLFGIIAYWLKQLLSDFKEVEKDIADIKSTSVCIQAEVKRISDLHNQRIIYLEKRNDQFETLIFKKKTNGKERNDLN